MLLWIGQHNAIEPYTELDDHTRGLACGDPDASRDSAFKANMEPMKSQQKCKDQREEAKKRSKRLRAEVVNLDQVEAKAFTLGG